jgi:Fic family protein
MSTGVNTSAHTTRATRLDDLLTRVRAEYVEMPGLSLTLAQAQRLWTLDQATCASVLRTLVERRFLRTTARGRYVRVEHAVR